MEPFEIQPTYSLHSLLRPNRLVDRLDEAAGCKRARSCLEDQPACQESERALCDA